MTFKAYTLSYRSETAKCSDECPVKCGIHGEHKLSRQACLGKKAEAFMRCHLFGFLKLLHNEETVPGLEVSEGLLRRGFFKILQVGSI